MKFLTKRQITQIEQFLHVFADVEVGLKKRLGLPANSHARVSALTDDYATINPYWRDTADRLRTYAAIRNILTHQRGARVGYPVAVSPSSLQDISEIAQSLAQPRPVSSQFKRTVKCVSNEDTLAAVLSQAFENGFSQFPVVNRSLFGGLITENEIMRWLGRRARGNTTTVDLATASVKNVLKEKDPFMRGMSVFRFETLDAPVEEVMGRFSTERALEVVLLTKCGTNRSPIEGIVTQWDAARYAN